MGLTSQDTIEELRVKLLILQCEIQSYLDGVWVPEYHLTIGYNRVYTGRKKYTSIAQLEEQQSSELRVGGSSPSRGT